MELDEMKSMWQAYDAKLERSLKLNLHCLEMIQAKKVKDKLSPLLWLRIAEAILHLAMIVWLAGFLVRNFAAIKFVSAAFVLIVFFAVALVNCMKQVILIKEIGYNENILTIQKKLNSLQSHITGYISLTFLCIPTYLAYPVIAFKALGDFDISQINQKWWIANLLFSILITPACIWLYRQVSYKHIHKKWVRYIIEKSAGTRVAMAMEFIKEMDDLEKNSTVSL